MAVGCQHPAPALPLREETRYPLNRRLGGPRPGLSVQCTAVNIMSLLITFKEGGGNILL